MIKLSSLFGGKSAENNAGHDGIEVDLSRLILLRYHSSKLALSSHRRSMATIAGHTMSPFRGRGLDFEEVRPYQPGDDIRNIDWNVTARTNEVYTKIYNEERERPVFIITDFRDTMFFGTKHCLKSVAAAKASALIAWAAADNHNRVGGLIFTRDSHYELRPGGGYHGVLKYLRMLHHVHNRALHEYLEREETASDQINISKLFSRLRQMIHPGSLVLFASDFFQLRPDTFRHLNYISKHNDVIFCALYDQLEKSLPNEGRYKITDGQKISILNCNAGELKQRWNTMYQKQRDDLEDFCNANRIRLIQAGTGDSIPRVFMNALGRDNRIQRVAKNRH